MQDNSERPLPARMGSHYTDEMRAAKMEWEDRFMDLGNGRGWRSYNTPKSK